MSEPRPVTILTVEEGDQPGPALVAPALRQAGFQVLEARRGEEALRLAADQPDLILLDVRLPDLSGFDVCRQLRADAATAPIPVVYMYPSQNFSKERSADALVGGADGYLVKPAEPAELLSTVRAFLRVCQAEEAARAAAEDAEHLRRLLEASAEGLVSLDAAGRFTYVNRAAAQLLGAAPAELLGQDMHARIHQPPAGDAPHAADQCPITRALRSGQPLRVENDTFWGRGSFAVEYQVAPLFDRGAVRGAAVTFRDVSEHKRLEERFRQSQKMEPVGRLASGVTHDFNNLLTIISGYCEILLARLDPHDPVRDMLVEIKKAEERAAELTRQLLAFSRKQILEPKVLDLNAVLADVSKLLRRLIGEDVELRLQPAAGLGGVRGDVGQLEQVLLNLAVNARDAMPQGGTLTLRTANVERTAADVHGLPGAAPGPYVLLAVSDTGCGMTAEVRAHLFEPFYTTKEPGKGTGLGLSTVYGIVKQSGGFIEVDSVPGRGTTFRIYLPRVAELGRREPAPAAPTSYRGQETILVTEEDVGLGELIAKVLGPLGYKVLTARTAAEAAQVCTAYEREVHLLMCDVVLPQTTGRELFQRLAALRPELRVLFISGYANGLAAAGGAEGEAPVLPKPFATEALARKVREVLDGVAVA
jgi:PAS domain S-box-containing protein